MAIQIRDLIVAAPGELRAALGTVSSADRAVRSARFQLTGDMADPIVATKLALRTLARCYEALSGEMTNLQASQTLLRNLSIGNCRISTRF